MAAARTAVLDHFPKLAMTHQLAKYLEREMRKVGVDILSPAETSMVSAGRERETHSQNAGKSPFNRMLENV